MQKVLSRLKVNAPCMVSRLGIYAKESEGGEGGEGESNRDDADETEDRCIRPDLAHGLSVLTAYWLPVHIETPLLQLNPQHTHSFPLVTRLGTRRRTGRASRTRCFSASSVPSSIRSASASFMRDQCYTMASTL